MITLEDIHRNMQENSPQESRAMPKLKTQSSTVVRRQMLNAEPENAVAEEEQEYEDGDITGYAMASVPYSNPYVS